MPHQVCILTTQLLGGVAFIDEVLPQHGNRVAIAAVEGPVVARGGEVLPEHVDFTLERGDLFVALARLEIEAGLQPVALFAEVARFALGTGQFGAGREQRIYALPPYTRVVSLDFEDHPFERTRFDKPCALCGATGVYLDEIVTDDAGGRMFVCSDTDFCEGKRPAGAEPQAQETRR